VVITRAKIRTKLWNRPTWFRFKKWKKVINISKTLRRAWINWKKL